MNINGAYLLDDGETMIIYICHGVSPAFLSDMFGVAAFSQIQDESRTLPQVETDGNEALHAFIDKLNEDRPYPSGVLILRYVVCFLKSMVFVIFFAMSNSKFHTLILK